MLVVCRQDARGTCPRLTDSKSLKLSVTNYIFFFNADYKFSHHYIINFFRGVGEEDNNDLP